MRRQHPNHKMDIPVSMEVWQQLLKASMATCFKKEDWEIAAEAIDEWVRRHNPDSISKPLVHGYQWKSVFLPDGTLLRTVFGGKNHHCLVEGDQILHNGQAVSPSGFVNAVGGIRRNAWQCTWILLPNSQDWKLANTLRSHERPPRARKPVRGIQQAPEAQPDSASAPAAASPATGPLPVQSDTTAGVPDAFPVRKTCHDRAPRINPNAERRNRRQNTDTLLSPIGFARGADRRMNRDERMMALLRQELLPLLYRMSIRDGAFTEHEDRA
jgi:hypothetical protein